MLNSYYSVIATLASPGSEGKELGVVVGGGGT